MTINHRKKNERQRGRKTHGWGAKKKHRGGGSRGGRGFSGHHKHKFSYVVTKEQDHFGYKGFFSRAKKARVINLDDVQKMATGTTINLTEQGYDKLLAKGTVSKPLKIIVAFYSKRAKEKLESAGGSIVE